MPQGVLCGRCLRAVNVALRMDDLGLKICCVYFPGIYHSDLSHACCRKVLKDRRSQRPCAEYYHAGSLDPLLALYAYLAKEKVPAESLYLLVVKRYFLSSFFRDNALPFCRSSCDRGEEDDLSILIKFFFPF